MSFDRLQAEDHAPLSPRQRLIWLENELTPELPTNIEVCYLTVEGALDMEVLDEAFRRLCLRHDALRARLVLPPEAGMPEMVFDPTPPIALERLSIVPGGLRAELSRLSRRPFAIGEPLVRAAILSDGGLHHLALLQSHLITDGQSMLLLCEDLSAFYEDVLRGHAPPPAGSAFREWLDASPSNQRSEAEAFWNGVLAEPVEEMRLYGQTPAPSRGATARLRREIPARAAEALAARQHGFAPSHVLTAVMAATIHRATGNGTVALGVPVLNRTLKDARTAGLLMEVVPNRLAVDPASSLRDLAGAVGAFARASRPHRHHIVSGARSGHRAILNYYPPAPDNFAGRPAHIVITTALELQENECMRPALDGPGLSVVVSSDRSGRPYEIAFDFDAVRWPDPALHQRFAAHFMAVLHAFVDDPDSMVGAIEIVTEEERAEISGDDEAAGDFAERLPDLLVLLGEAAAARQDHPAVVFEERTLSYGELLARVEAVAAGLIARGVSSGSLVALRMERSEALVVAMLGVLRAGAAYVPLDPTHPESRIRMILDDADPALTVVDVIDDVAEALAPERAAAFDDLAAAPPPATLPPPGEVAYVIFTSGSTGRPKGVRVRRHGLSAFLLAMRERPGFAASDRLLSVTTVAFDIAALELFLPLVTGGTLHIAPHAATIDGAELARRMAAGGITVFQATPATYRLLLAAGWNGRGVRALCGGEALPEDLARRLIATCDEVWNMYGPTETTIWSSVERITAETLPVTIGRPIRGTRFSVRTPQGALTPPGAPGELNIAGHGVADGYHARPELTAEKFVPNGAGDRRYRTGDAVRRLPDGRFAYLGRIDFQVKVRGFRIELGEVEARIGQVRGVESAAVVPFEDRSGETALAGFYGGDGSAETRRAIEAHLAAGLPAYMRPAILRHLAAMPLTPNGKIDRKALPAPEADDAVEAPGAADIEDDLQRSLAAVWERVLGRRGIGAESNFFESGGHSILALTLIREVERTLGVALDLGSVFRAPTLREMAARIRAGAAGAPAAIVTLQDRGEGPPLFCICGIELYRPLAEALGVDRPVHAIYVEEEAEFLAMAASGNIADISIEGLAKSYARAILRACPDGPYRLAGVSFGGVLALETAREIEAAGREVGLVAMIDTMRRNSRRIDWPAYAAAKLRSLADAGPRAALARVWRRLSDRTARYITAARAGAPSTQRLREIAFIRATEQHEAAFALRAPVLLVKAGDRSMWGAGQIFLEDYGWSAALGKEIRVVEVPGDHLGILNPPHVARLAACLGRELDTRKNLPAPPPM